MFEYINAYTKVDRPWLTATGSSAPTEKGSSEKTMDDIYVSDDELHVPFLPQVSPLADDPLIFFM